MWLQPVRWLGVRRLVVRRLGVQQLGVQLGVQLQLLCLVRLRFTVRLLPGAMLHPHLVFLKVHRPLLVSHQKTVYQGLAQWFQFPEAFGRQLPNLAVDVVDEGRSLVVGAGRGCSGGGGSAGPGTFQRLCDGGGSLENEHYKLVCFLLYLSQNFHIYVSLGEFIKVVTTVYCTYLTTRLFFFAHHLGQDVHHVLVPCLVLTEFLGGPPSAAAGLRSRVFLRGILGMSKSTAKNEAKKDNNLYNNKKMLFKMLH